MPTVTQLLYLQAKTLVDRRSQPGGKRYYLQHGNQARDCIDHVNDELNYVRLQYADVSVIGLLDQDEKQYQRDDAHNQQEDATEQAFVRFRAIDLPITESC